jgi:gliding motility-associated-like protein
MVFTDGTTGCSSNLTSGIVTVNPMPIVSDTTGGFVCEGYGMYFTSTSSGTWTSSNPTIATIDNTGYVTGIAIGTANMVFTDGVTGCKNSITSGLVVVGGVTAILDVTPSLGIMPLEVVFTNGSAPAITYLWDFGDGTPITSVFNPNHIYTDFGDFIATLIVTDGFGCFDTATVTIEVQGISSILIPNVFTPNGDGFNDVFTVGGTNLESVEAEIFNRWGQKMYEWKHVKGYWDGRTQSGLEAPEGTYFYIISAKGLDGEEYFKKGGFSLIR